MKTYFLGLVPFKSVSKKRLSQNLTQSCCIEQFYFVETQFHLITNITRVYPILYPSTPQVPVYSFSPSTIVLILAPEGSELMTVFSQGAPVTGSKITIAP